MSLVVRAWINPFSKDAPNSSSIAKAMELRGGKECPGKVADIIDDIVMYFPLDMYSYISILLAS